MAPRTDSQFLILALSTAPAVSVAAAREENGVPVHRFRKELIRTGDFTKASESLNFSVTPDTLNKWVGTFAAMRAAGVKVPVPKSHWDEQGNPYTAEDADADANRGWLVDVYQEGDRLIGILDLVGHDAPRLAASNDVSIFVPPVFVDGEGRRYERPILHVALTPTPLIPGLSGWEAVAAANASKKPARVPVHILTTTEPLAMADMPMPDAGLAPAPTKPSDAIVAAFKEAVLKVMDDEKLDIATKLKKIRDLLKAQEKAVGMIDTDGDGEPDSIKEDDASPAVAASAQGDPMLLRLANENYAMKLDALVKEGRLTPACRAKLEETFLGQALALSVASKQASPLEGVLAALKEQAPAVALGEKTGAQTLALSNPLRGDALDEEAKRIRAEMAKNVANLCGATTR